MRNCLIAACVLAQALVLAWLVHGRETVISAGITVNIATAPIDPRDPFRGDFVRLRYGLNSLAYAPTLWVPDNTQPRKGDRIYAVLQERPGGLHDVDYFTNVQPGSSTDTLFLRGRLRTNNPGTGLNRVDVGYGIEQLFVEQGKGIGIEERQGLRGGLQTAMHAQVSLDEDGTAVLTGYSWSPLAVGIELSPNFALNRDATPEATTSRTEEAGTGTSDDSNNTEPSPLTLTVVNESNNDIVLNNPGDNCGFHLEPANRTASRYVEPDGVCSALASAPVTLMPGESLVIDIDLAAPRWHMSLPLNGETRTGDVRSFTDNGEWFRLVYRSARQPGVHKRESVISAEAADDNTDGDGDKPEQPPTEPGQEPSPVEFWQGELISRAFNAMGQVD